MCVYLYVYVYMHIYVYLSLSLSLSLQPSVYLSLSYTSSYIYVYVYTGCQKMYTHFKRCCLKMCIHFFCTPGMYMHMHYIQQCAICSHLFDLLSSKAENSSEKRIILEFRKYGFHYYMEIFKNIFLCALVFL